MIGATVIDTAVTPELRGRIVSYNAETLDVMVDWAGRSGMVSTLRPADIRAGRYVIVS